MEARDVPAQLHAIQFDAQLIGTENSAALDTPLAGRTVPVEADSADEAFDALNAMWEPGDWLSAFENPPTAATPNAAVSLLPDTAPQPGVTDGPLVSPIWTSDTTSPEGVTLENYLQPPDKKKPPEKKDEPKPADPKTAGIKVGKGALDHIGKADVTLTPRPDDAKTVDIKISGGHIAGSFPKSATVEVTVGGVRRKVTVTITEVPVDPNVDATKKPHEVRAVGATNDPDVTTVAPKDGDANSNTKTHFPTEMSPADRVVAIAGAIDAARKGQPGTKFTPSKGDPNKGTFEGTGNGVTIRGAWEIRDGKLEVTVAYPVITK